MLDITSPSGLPVPVTDCSHLSPFRAWCSVTLRVHRAQRASVRSLHAHTAHGIYRVRSGRCFLPRCPRAHFCISGSTHALTPMPPYVSLTPWVFPQSRAAADKSASLLSAPARFTATCLPNPETPSWAASHKGMRLSVRHELRSHTPHAIPLILAARCWLLLSASRPFKRPSSFQPLVVPYLHAAEYTRRLSLSSSLLFTG